jgi:hypothetical protein
VPISKKGAIYFYGFMEHVEYTLRYLLGKGKKNDVDNYV